jgi:CRISPR/Cas system-associated exonuclease Cas4 (RecB family)
VALVLGGALHDAIESYYRFLQQQGGAPPVQLLTDTFTTSWSRGALGDVPLRADDIGAEKDRGVALVEAYLAGVSTPLQVLAVEEAFSFPVADNDDRLVVGAIDAVVVDEDGRIVIVENKSAKRRWSADQLNYDFQPTMYTHAAREMGLADHPTLRYDFLLKLKKPAMESVEVYRTDEQVDEAFHLLRQVLSAIDQGMFYRLRSWACKDCEYGYLCNNTSSAT